MANPAVEYLEQRLEQYMNAGYNRGVLATLGSILLNAARNVLNLQTDDAIEALSDEQPLRTIGDHAHARWPQQWRQALFGPLSALMQAATAHNAPVFGSFDLANPRMAEQFNQYIDRLSGDLSETTRNNVEKVIHDAEKEGLSVPQTAQYLRDVAPEFNERRATLIARTELTTASNGASLIQAKESGVVAGKRWIATDDERTRPMHNLMDGDIVPIDKPFRNGLHFPQEPNCRCTLGWVLNAEDVPPYEEPEQEAEEEATEGPGEELVETQPSDPYEMTQETVGFLLDRGYSVEYLGNLSGADFRSVLMNEGWGTPDLADPEPEGDPGERYAERRADALRFEDEYEAEEWGQLVYEDWRDELDEQDKFEVNEYTGGSYRRVNKLLRDGVPLEDMAETPRRVIEGTTRALDSSIVAEDLIAYRGTLGRDVYENYLDGTVIGSTTRDKAFTSTSLDYGTAEMFSSDDDWDAEIPPIIAEIFLPGGHPGAYLDGLSRHRTEREMLLPPGTEFRVVGYREQTIAGEDGIIFYLEPVE